MQVTFIEFLQLVKVIRMLYGVQVAKEFFEYHYQKLGFSCSIKYGRVVLPQEDIKKKEGK